MDENGLKTIVRRKYGEIARNSAASGGCCGESSCCGPVYSIMADDYLNVEGHESEADLGLGCGIPTEYAGIQPGMTVLDLGSGAGNDAFIALRMVGDAGRVVGVDMTPDMVERANANKARLGASNVEFRLGEIESLPVENSSVDVVISNCVLNLVPDKRRAFAEIARVLKPGAHFCISDIVLEGRLSEGLRSVAELYAGCVSGAIQKKEYLDLMSAVGFVNVEIAKEKKIVIPHDVLQELVADLPESERDIGAARLLSVTIMGYKP